MKIEVNAKAAQITERETLTVGSKGIMIAISFSPEWDGLNKTALFWDGTENEAIPVLMFSDFILLPPEMTATKALKPLVTFVGKDAEGTVVFPAVECPLGSVWYGIRGGKYPTEPPSPDWVQQIESGVFEANKTANKALQTVTDNKPLTERAEAAAQAAEAAQESAAGSMSSAALSAQQAGRDAGQAAASAAAANASDYSAAESAQQAGVSASTATVQASAAAKSATQAQEAQEAAAASAAAAAGSEAGVTADANRAGAEATRAAQDAERATRAAQSAEDDAGFARASQEAAAGSAGAASTSAGQAAASEKAAQQAATNAGASADQAQTDALTATGAAQSAKTEAGRAKSEADRSAAAAALSVAHGITGAKVGDLMQITAVDSKGVPTALKPTSLEELEGKWEIIEEIVTDADAIFNRNTAPGGKPYKFSALQVLYKCPKPTPGNATFQIIDDQGRAANYFKVPEGQYVIYQKCEIQDGFAKCENRCQLYDYVSSVYQGATLDRFTRKYNYIARLLTEEAIPAGTKVTIIAKWVIE